MQPGSTRVSRVVSGVTPETSCKRDGRRSLAGLASTWACALREMLRAALCSPRQFGGTPNWTRGTRVLPVARAGAVLLLALFAAGLGCSERKVSASQQTTGARALFEQTTKEFHNRSAEAHGAERERLLTEAAARYERLLKEFSTETNVCAEALLALGNVYASQGKTNEAVKRYAAVSEKYPGRDWEVLQAWKAAGDLLWDASRREDAKNYYARIVERYDRPDAPAITKAVVRGSKTRLAQ
jgi:hypothetical protein